MHFQNITTDTVWRKDWWEERMEQKKNQLGIGQTRDEVLGRKVMLRWGKVYRFEKNIDDIGRN